MVSRVLVAACLLCVAHGATSDAKDDTDLNEDDMKLLIDKLGDDEFVDQVVGKMVDKLFSSDLSSLLQGQDDQEPLDLSEYEDADHDEQANAEADQEYDDQQDEDEQQEDNEQDNEQDDEQDNEQDNEQEDAEQQEDNEQEDTDQQEQEEEPATEELAAEPADDSNSLFALCDPGTLAMSSALGAGLACVVFFVKTLFERMFFTKKEADLLGYAMLEA